MLYTAYVCSSADTVAYGKKKYLACLASDLNFIFAY